MWHAFDGLVVSLVAKKQYFNAARLLGESSGEEKGEGEEEFHCGKLRRLKGLKGLK